MLSRRNILFLFLVLGSTLSHSQDINFRYRVDKMAIFHGDSQVSPYQFTELCSYSDGLTWAAQGELYGYVDSFGREIIPYIYHDVRSFEHGVAFVSIDFGYHFGLINTKGDSISPAIFDEALPFTQELAPVRMGDFWGLLSTSGQLVYPCESEIPPSIAAKNFVIIRKAGLYQVVDCESGVKYSHQFDFISKNGEAYNGQKKFWINMR